MSDYITTVKTAQGSKRIDYNALANLPDLSSKADLGADGKVSPDQLPDMLPSVTDADNGQFLTVVNGKWSAKIVMAAEQGVF